MTIDAITAIRNAHAAFAARCGVAATLSDDMARDVYDVTAKPGQAFAWMIRPSNTWTEFVGAPEQCFHSMTWQSDGCTPVMPNFDRMTEDVFNDLQDGMVELWFWADHAEFVRCTDASDLHDRFLVARLRGALVWAHERGTDKQIELIENELLAHGM